MNPEMPPERDLHLLRWGLLLACLGSWFVVASNAHWELRLNFDNASWIIPVQAPLWHPPAAPTYKTFQTTFADVPAPSARGLFTERELLIDVLILDFVIWLCPVCVVGGLAYRAIRGKRRDLILHIGLWLGLWLSIGGGLCVGLWILIGRWGPPHPIFFGSLSFMLGVAWGIALFFTGEYVEADPQHRGNANP